MRDGPRQPMYRETERYCATWRDMERDRKEIKGRKCIESGREKGRGAEEHKAQRHIKRHIGKQNRGEWESQG